MESTSILRAVLPFAGGQKKRVLAVTSRVAGASSPAAKSRRRQRCSSTFEEGSSRKSVQPFVSGWLDPHDAVASERWISTAKAGGRLVWSARHRPG
jgi:hypothetical protein